MGTYQPTIFPVKTCTKCGEIKLWIHTFFNWSDKKRKRLRWICKECQHIYDKQYRESNPIYVKKRLLKYRKENVQQLKEYTLQYYINNKESILLYKKENAQPLKEYRKLYRESNSKRIKQTQDIYRNSFVLFSIYEHQLTIEEDPKKDKNGYLLTKCAYCGKYFLPMKKEILQRVAALEGRGTGECRLYCSQGCKDACPIYHQRIWPKGYKKATSREVNPLIRQMCLKRDEYECQKCGETIDTVELHTHHIESVIQMPMLANDVENTITFCKPCHIWVHQQDGCKYTDIGKIKC
jgi:5-methylcytosine-specific restriction endonuclease McrA